MLVLMVVLGRDLIGVGGRHSGSCGDGMLVALMVGHGGVVAGEVAAVAAGVSHEDVPCICYDIDQSVCDVMHGHECLQSAQRE